jgi:hypothetical protein
MQHLAIRSDRQPPNTENYSHQQDVFCAGCRLVTYQLWSPDLETEVEAVQAQAEWLNRHLMFACPEHPDNFCTPDRPEPEQH